MALESQDLGPLLYKIRTNKEYDEYQTNQEFSLQELQTELFEFDSTILKPWWALPWMAELKWTMMRTVIILRT